MKANDIRPGTALNLNGVLQIVVKADHVKPGKGPAYVAAKIKSVATGAVTEKRFRTVEDVEHAILDRRKMQYLYSDASGRVFMDNESYDQITISEELLGDAMLYIKENEDVDVMFYQDNPISLDVAKAVNLEVTDTAPQPKGATATNQLKEATLETGLKVRVPPFIEIGEVVRINTDDNSYLGRKSVV